MFKVRIRMPCLPFRDITGNRDSCPAELHSQTKNLFGGKSFRQHIDQFGELDRFLPNQQILEIRHSNASCESLTSVNRELSTVNYLTSSAPIRSVTAFTRCSKHQRSSSSTIFSVAQGSK